MIIRDKFPLAENHILVLPKEHIPNAKHLSQKHVQLGKKVFQVLLYFIIFSSRENESKWHRQNEGLKCEFK